MHGIGIPVSSIIINGIHSGVVVMFDPYAVPEIVLVDIKDPD